MNRQRKLVLGSVSSLSFEEEENEFYFNEDQHHNTSNDRFSSTSSLGSCDSHHSGMIRFQAPATSSSTSTLGSSHGGHGHGGHHHDFHMELHEFLTDRLEEQVSYLLNLSYRKESASTPLSTPPSGATPILTIVGLHSTLTEAVHDILHLSEEEPYGVRGATIILKMADASVSFGGKFKNPDAAGGAVTPAGATTKEETTLGVIAVDTSTVSTFNLTLVLKEERRWDLSLKNWFKGQFTGGKREQLISSEFTVRKEKLYRNRNGGRIGSSQGNPEQRN